jgi:putative nucleotidyltransferase with HDIG domain
LRFEFGLGFDEATKEALRRADFSNGRGVFGWVAKNRLPVNVPDVSNDPRWLPIESQVRSALFVPVEHENQVRGVLSVLSKHAAAFTPQDERLLVLFANQAAVALENARLFEETQRRLAELEAVNKISAALRLSQTLEEMLPALLDEILTILGTSAGQITLRDAHTDVLHVAVARGWFAQAPEVSSANEGIRVHVMKTGRAYALREFKSDPNTSETARAQVPADWGGALVPLRAGRDTVGVLAISVPLPREIQPHELQLLNTLAEIAGNAIHRAHLHGQTERQVRHLASLHTIDMAITASLDLKFSLDIILEQIIRELSINAADVLLLKPQSQSLEYAAGRGFRTDSLKHTRLRLGEGLAGRAALERRTIIVPDLAQDADGLLRTKKLADEQFVAYLAAPLLAKGQVKGVLEIFHRAALNPDLEWLDFLEALATQLAIAIDSAELFIDLQRSNVELALAYDTTLEGWGRALDLRDKETEGHTERVAKLTVKLARQMGLSEAELNNLRRGTLLHDIGKMGIPDHILFKPEELTPEEWEIMRKHPVYAYELLLPITYLRDALDIPYCHHEKWDGSGYPRGLKGEQIPLAARIFALVDVWDALCSDRPYRKAWSKERALEFIRTQRGKHFDPKVVEVFLKYLDEHR